MRGSTHNCSNLDSQKQSSYFNLNESTKTSTADSPFTPINNIKPKDEKNNNLQTSSNLTAFDKEFRSDMFAAFDTHFKNEKSTNKNNSVFGDPVSSGTSSEFVANFDDVFKNNFEDEFSTMNIVSNGKNDNDKKLSDKNYNLESFSRYTEKQDNTRIRNNTDTNTGSNNGFNSMFASSNKNILEKNVYKKGSDKVSDKFVADFSKSDNYDKDLEEALKRSLVDQ